MAAGSLKELEIMSGSPPSSFHMAGDANYNSEAAVSAHSRRPMDIDNTTGVNSTKAQDSDPSFSPKSPSSLYTTSTIEKSKGCVIHAFLLSYWDNIMGPKIHYLWNTKNDKTIIKQDNLSYVAGHTLTGEICRNPSDASIDTQFCVVKDRNIVVTSFIFGAMQGDEAAVHSLSLIVPHSNLNEYLNIHELCVSWVSRLVSKLRVLLVKECDVVMACFSGYLTIFVDMLNSLKEAGIPRSIPLSDTAFHPQHKYSPGLLRRAITCSLMTCGRTVVIGSSPSRINIMLATLAMFVSPADRYISRYATDSVRSIYQPDLILQGILKDESTQDLADSLQDLYLSRYPSTLVDLRTGDVKLSGLPHEHDVKRESTIKQELESLWQGYGGTDYPTSDMFHTIDDPETLVSNFMDELYLLPATHGLRESYVKHFLSILDRKAMALLKYVKSEISQNPKLSLKDSVKQLKHNLGLTVPGDFFVVLAAAEKLKPGIYSFLCGDTKSDAEFRHYLGKSGR